MNIPVLVELKNLRGEATRVMDDELDQLIREGLVTYKGALNALKDAGLELDKRYYPWLRDIENWANGEFDKLPKPVEDKPELLSKEDEAKVHAMPDRAPEVKPEDNNDNEGAE